MPVAPPPVADRAPEAPADGDASPAHERPFLLRYCEGLVSRPGRLLTAVVATTLGALAVSEAAGHTPVPVPATIPAAEFKPVVAIDAPPEEVAEWSVVARAASETCPGLYPEVLVAIAHVESRFGKGGGRSPAGAVGPMQFMPDTWAAYATDGDNDGRTDVMDPVDAMFGTARFLCDQGGSDPANLRTAIWKYNHSRDYVAEILRAAGLAERVP